MKCMHLVVEILAFTLVIMHTLHAFLSLFLTGYLLHFAVGLFLCGFGGLGTCKFSLKKLKQCRIVCLQTIPISYDYGLSHQEQLSRKNNINNI